MAVAAPLAPSHSFSFASTGLSSSPSFSSPSCLSPASATDFLAFSSAIPAFFTSSPFVPRYHCARPRNDRAWRRGSESLLSTEDLEAALRQHFHVEWGHNFRCFEHDESVSAIEGGKARCQEISQRPFKTKEQIGIEKNGPLYALDDDIVLSEENLQDVSLLKAVVKVYCISAEPDYQLPWQLKRQQAATGSGFMISGRRLLTNAHCVEHHTQVKVKRTGDDNKYIATVLAIGGECDLALLTVDNEEFWRDVEPLQFGSLPNLQDAVTVVGYPVGGNTISVTKGVVSRIEVTSYAHGDSELLALQIDAAINAGNSGGPAFNEDGDCVGIAFQAYSDAENIGYVIPTSVISHFLTDYNMNGSYTGFPYLGLWLQKLENPDLRTWLKMKHQQKGVLIRRVEPTSPCKNIIKEGDVILSFDGIPVGNEATVPFRPGERIAFNFLVSQKFIGDQAVLGILRDGNKIKVTVTMKPRVHLVPVHIKGRQPSYFVIAGLIFTPVTEHLLQEDCTGESLSIGIKVRAKSRHEPAEFEGEEIVLLAQVLANEFNIGYEDINHVQLSRFNGTKIKNIRHLAQLVDACDSEYMHFELDENMLIVLVTKSAHVSTSKVLKDYCIAYDRSRDLRGFTENVPLNGAIA